MLSAKIIADSISESGIRITTMELEFERFILSQFNTHRMFSRSAQSSRAVPTKKMIESIFDSEPPRFAQNQAGMQSGELLNDVDIFWASKLWNEAKIQCIESAKEISEINAKVEKALKETNIDDYLENDIIKRCSYLRLSPSNIEKYYIHAISKNFTKHLINSLFITMIEEPTKISKKIDFKYDYKNKILNSTLGKVEILRRVYYGENVEENKKHIFNLKMSRCYKETDNIQLVYKCFEGMGCTLFEGTQKGAGKKKIYKIDEAEYDYHRELKMLRKEEKKENIIIDTCDLD